MSSRLLKLLGLLGACVVVFVLAKPYFVASSKDLGQLNVAKKADYVTKERKFVIVVASYNNENYYERNLDSLFSQEYKNYRVIYVDDASQDATYQLVKDYIERKGVADKITLIHNETNQKKIHNVFKMIHSCDNEDIVLIVDGDDRLTNPYVLRDLNYYYENPEVWLTYGQYIRYPDNSLGCSLPVTKKELKEGKLRNQPWKFSHLTTFYAGLFKRIKLEDLMCDGKFIEVTGDLAMMYPMLEMAREHAFFTPDVSYEYNWVTPLTDTKIRPEAQEKTESYIRHLSVYPPLKEHPKTAFGQKETDVCDVVAFTYNRPMQTYAFLESLYTRARGFRKVMVIARIDPEYEEGYQIVKDAFPEVLFFQQSQNPKADFKPLTLDLSFGAEGKGADYIMFGVDDLILTDDIDIRKDIVKLQETSAYGMYYRLGTHINLAYMMFYSGVQSLIDNSHGTPDLIDLGDDCYTWRFSDSKGDWNYPNSQDLVLYKKEDIKKDIEKIKFTFPNNLEAKWAEVANLQKFGLCHYRAKMINIPMNVVSGFQNVNANTYTIEELNDLFMQGLKIDISQLYLIENISVHADIHPQFVPRNDVKFVHQR